VRGFGEQPRRVRREKPTLKEILTRSIYRSEAGSHAIREWCERQFDDAGATGHDLDTPLGRTRVTTVGSGPDIVLLPGTNFSTATGLRLLTLVGRENRAIGVDLPGQPGLSAGERPVDRDAYGAWLREVVHQLDLERPVVVGHSLGGRAALLAAQGDQSIGGLVLVASAGLIRVRPAMLTTTILWLVRRDETSSAALLRGMAAPGADLPAQLATWLALVARHVRTSLAPPPLPRAALAEIRCPVWLVAGCHDRFLPARGLVEALTRLGGPTAAKVVETAGHLLPEEAPHEVLRAVEAAARDARSPSPPASRSWSRLDALD
jgi:pimeloyl-ACP methyl ester carboxylesterase